MTKETPQSRSEIYNKNLPPRVPGLPVLGSAYDFLYRPIEFFLEAYHQYGPIFRIQALNQRFVVMGGLEANRFLAKEGEEHFSSEPLFGEFGREMGAEYFLVSLDGEPHRHMRKVMQRGYSKGGIAPHIDDFAAMTYRRAESWQVGEVLYVRDQMQRLVTQQVGIALTNHSPEEYFEPLRTYFSTMLNVLVIKRWPRLMLYTPNYRRAKKEVMSLAKMVLDEHRNGKGEHEPDLINDLVAAEDWNGKPFKENDLLAATLGPYFAGMDTVASTLGFFLYAVLKHPDVLDRIVAEVDEYFADGIPSWRELPKMQALYGATIETLRRYPATPFTPRGVVEPFTFQGCHVEAGQEIIIVNGLTHFLPEFFPEPFSFDIERYIPPRKEHKQGMGIFAPYTLGPHTCLGAGAAEVMLMVTMGALLRAVRLELEPKDYELKIKLTPIPSPEKKFRVRVLEHRI
jgi:cytochrome P450